VFDRGDADYEWFVNLIQQGVHFVTRLKENADYGVVEELAVPRRRGVLRDQVIFSINWPRRASMHTSGASSFTMKSTIECWCF